jgi:hypothetical protein
MGRVTAEIEIMKTLRHPHLVQLFEVLRDDKNIYLIMEFMEVVLLCEFALYFIVLTMKIVANSSLRAGLSCLITPLRIGSAATCLARSSGTHGEKCLKSGRAGNSRKFVAALRKRNVTRK